MEIVKDSICSGALRLSKYFGGIFFLESRFIREKDLDTFVWFNPNGITRCLNMKSQHLGRSFVKRGNWDKDGVSLIQERHPAVYHTIRQLFLQDKPYRETDQYKVMKQAVEKYQKGECEDPRTIGAYWCRFLNDIDRYFSLLIDSYNDIKSNGYKTQEQLMKEQPGGAHYPKDEVRIYIGRDGGLILGVGGTHRLLIAQHLELTEIPGVVRGIHESWALRQFEKYGRDYESLKEMLLEGIAEHDNGIL